MVIILLSTIAVLLYLLLAALSNNGVKECIGIAIPVFNWFILGTLVIGSVGYVYYLGF